MLNIKFSVPFRDKKINEDRKEVCEQGAEY
jgi:hypothetical protein